MSLQVWLPLTEDLTNQGLSDLAFVPVGTTTVVDNNGKLGKCYSNSSNTAGGLISDKAIDLGTTVSMCCWFKYTSLEASSNLGGGLIAQHCYTDSTGLGITIKYVSSTTGYISCSTGTGSSRTYNTYCGTTLLQANTWYHATLTYDGTTIRLYLNGVMEKSVTYTQKNKNNQIGIFAWSVNGGAIYGNYKLNGSLNDVRVYDNCLSAKAIKEIAEGLVCHYKLNNDARGGLLNLLKYSKVNSVNQSLLSTYSSAWTSKMTIANIDSYDCYYYPSTQNSTWFSSGYWYSGLTANTTYTYSAYIYFTANANFGFSSLGHFQVYNASSTASDKSHEDVVSARIYEPSTIKANTWTKIRITFTTNGLDGSKFCIYPRYNLAANTGDLYFRDCKLEVGDKPTIWTPNASDNEYTQLGYNENIIYDSSGLNNHMTAYGSPTISTNTVRNSVSTHFINGQYALAQSNSNVYLPKDAVTVNLWMNCSTWGNPISCTEGGGWNFESASAGIQFPCYISGVGYKVANSGVAASTLLNAWHMLTGVFDGTSVKIYIDAELKATTATGSTNGIGYAANRLVISGEAGSSTPASSTFVGEISDVRIYATSLSAEDIKALYNTPVSISNAGAVFTQGEFVEV